MPPKRLPSRFVVLGIFAIGALLISILYSIFDSTRRSYGTQPVTPTPPPATTPVRDITQQPVLLPATDPPRATPVATAPMLRLAGWSSGGEWLAYWLSSTEDVASQVEPRPQTQQSAPDFGRLDFAWPEASLAFYNPQTAQNCPHPDLSSWDASYLGEWTPEGEAVVKMGEEFYAVPPCGPAPYSPLPDFQIVSAPAVDPALSPGGDFRALSTLLNNEGGVLSFTTGLASSADSRVVISTSWQIDERLGDYSAFLGGEWLSPSQFLIHETLDRGPLILDTTAGRVVPVLPELFGQEEIPSLLGEQGYLLHAAAIPAGQAGDYHLLLSGVGEEGNFPPARLYHAENGEMETLPYRYPYSSGILQGVRGKNWLLMDARPIVDGYERHAVYFREVEDNGGEWRSLGENVEGILWNSTGSQAAIGSGARLDWLDFPSLERRGSWITRPYIAYPAAFSAQGCRLAAVGNQPGLEDYGLFVLPGCPLP